MPLRHPIIAAAFAVLFVPFATRAEAIDWIPDREIGTYCQQFLTRPESPSGTVCMSYIQGFLDGLRTTATPSREALGFDQPEEAATREEQRVSAVRMEALVEEFGPPARAGICLPENFTAEEIARVIARGVRQGSGYSRGALDDYAQRALRTRYPCDTSEPEVPAETPIERDDAEGGRQ
ncbi:MAG TPA: Rap1a/Tai family immunity protein [Gammaproteobacteria bacterium]